MADILTQLQTCLDQLATQFYATLGYLSTYHDNSPAIPPSNIPTASPALAKIPKNSTAHPVPASAPSAPQTSPPQPAAAGLPRQGGGAGGTADPNQSPPPPGAAAAIDPHQPPAPDSPRTFAARQRELARDLVIKEQQIEYLISVLPGIDSSEAEQERRIRELEGELRRVEEERQVKMGELRRLRKRLDRVLGGVGRGIYG